MARLRYGNPAGFYGRKIRAMGIMIFVSALLLILAATGYAHRVVLFAWIEGDIVYAQSKFPGGMKVAEGDITVFDDTGRELLTGKTDHEGAFSFSLKTMPQPSALKIVLNAGMGHQGHWNLTRSEVCQALGVDEDPPADNHRTDMVQQQPVRSEAPRAGSEENALYRLSETDLRKIVEETVDRKLSPVMEMLISIREEMAVGLDDVVAGVGYILGLTGLVAWFYARKKGEGHRDDQ